ncbi:MAG: hypothetical protein SFX73_12460 [Kofleriaceae bacterium]|nr:hypothetical protein [Kofleriaceae bacterium]
MFATEPEHILWRVEGGVPVELARLPELAWQLAIHGDTVFVAMPDDLHTTIAAIPLAGGPSRTLATHPHGMSRMVVDDDHIWWAGATA